jgi:hypothetical protein
MTRRRFVTRDLRRNGNLCAQQPQCCAMQGPGTRMTKRRNILCSETGPPKQEIFLLETSHVVMRLASAKLENPLSFNFC